MKLSSVVCCCRKKRFWCRFRCRRHHNYDDEKEGVVDNNHNNNHNNNNNNNHLHDEEKKEEIAEHYSVKKTTNDDYNNIIIKEEEEEVDDNIDTTNWMSKISDSTILADMVLPGSHDAGMSEAHDVLPGGIAKSKVIKLTQTQNLSILDQLKAGSRYLDLRVDLINNNNNSRTRTKSKSRRASPSSDGENSANNNIQEEELLVTYHRNSHKLGMDGQSLTSIFDQLHQFLHDDIAPSSETVIVKFSHIGGGIDGQNSNETKMKVANFLSTSKKYQDLLYYASSNDSTTVNLLKLPLGSIRGKVVVVMDYDELIDPTHGRFRYRDYNNNNKGQTTNIRVYDHYSNTDSVEIMSNDQLTKWKSMMSLQQQQQQQQQQQSDNTDYYMFLLSWTLTPQGLFSSSIKSLSTKANNKLSEILQSRIIQNKWKPPNIVYIDYITPQLGKMIVQYNFITTTNNNSKNSSK